MVRILIGAGGTGGHVYPALAVAEAIRKLAAEHKLYFVGTRGGGGFERRLVDASDFNFDTFDEVFAGPIVGVNPFRALLSLILMGLGLLQSLVLLLRYRPQVILFTGGWANVPVALAGWFLRTPMLVYLPDIEPGSTIRALGRFVQKVATTVPESAQFFRAGQTVTTGYPLRGEVTSAKRDAAIEHFKLDSNLKTVLVTGGSRGARSINYAVENILSDLLKETVQVIHVTGELDWERSQAAVKRQMAHYHPYEYLDSREMGLAFAAADIVVGRSGASALGEFPYFGAASILVPYPHAWRYQRVNADWLAERGAGICMDDEKMAAELLPSLVGLLRDEERLKTMQACAKAVYQGDGSANIARELLGLAREA
jgi:undecaprenyldiphospho-muramoylpentapeptide beta-N-acetylglucosaminyltransferase